MLNSPRIISKSTNWEYLTPVFLGAILFSFAFFSIQTASAQSGSGSLKTRNPVILSMQTPIGEAHIEIPAGTAFEQATIANGWVQLERGPFIGWVRAEETTLVERPVFVPDQTLSPQALAAPEATQTPQEIPKLESPYPIQTIIILSLGAALIILSQIRTIQKWFFKRLRQLSPSRRKYF